MSDWTIALAMVCVTVIILSIIGTIQNWFKDRK